MWDSCSGACKHGFWLTVEVTVAIAVSVEVTICVVVLVLTPLIELPRYPPLAPMRSASTSSAASVLPFSFLSKTDALA